MKIGGRSSGRGSDSLSPLLSSRIRALGTRGTFRSVRMRRVVAAGLVVAAGVVAIAAARAPADAPIVVAAADLRPGTVISAGDLSVRRTPPEHRPVGAFSDVDAVVGQRLTGPLRTGEVLTESRLLTTRLPRLLTGSSSARLVPVRPADGAVTQLVRQGDLVDVVDAESAVLARDAVVAVAPGIASGNRPAGSEPILLAMDQASAQRVAATGLGTALALLLH